MEAELAGTRPMLTTRQIGRIARIARPLIVAVALAVALVLALMLPKPAQAESTPGIAGPYLAAENAARRGDIAEAARLYTQALSHDRGNASLMERALTQQTAAGQIDLATAVTIIPSNGP